MTAREIVAALGGKWHGHRGMTCCPAHDDRSPSLSLSDGERALLVHCFAGCEPRDVLAALRARGLLDGPGSATDERRLEELARRRREQDGRERRRRERTARRIWDFAREARGTPVEHYLRVRGITLSPPPVLRYTRALRRLDGSCAPAMVARVDNLDGKLIGVHRTWLERVSADQWHRRDRASLGPIGGGAARLAPAAETLMVGEGIETCLAAMQATAMPAWAALSTSGMVALMLPPIVRTVIILADHDRSGAGERAARDAAARWRAEGRRVSIAMPPERGTDFADVLAGCAYAQVRDAAE
jgi:hypothetical protein